MATKDSKLLKSWRLFYKVSSEILNINIKVENIREQWQFKCTDMTHLYIRYGEDANLISQHAFRPVLIHTTNHSKNIILRADRKQTCSLLFSQKPSQRVVKNL